MLAKRLFAYIRLAASGAVIGLATVKAISFAGVDITPFLEQIGMGAGAVGAIALIKALHIIPPA